MNAYCAIWIRNFSIMSIIKELLDINIIRKIDIACKIPLHIKPDVIIPLITAYFCVCF